MDLSCAQQSKTVLSVRQSLKKKEKKMSETWPPLFIIILKHLQTLICSSVAYEAENMQMFQTNQVLLFRAGLDLCRNYMSQGCRLCSARVVQRRCFCMARSLIDISSADFNELSLLESQRAASTPWQHACE